MNILVATNHLDTIGGTETFTYSLIEELKRRKYNVEYYTLQKGIVSDKIEKELGVNFSSKEKYDLILANHNTTVNKLFGKGFIIQTCHGATIPKEQPCWKANAFVSISKEIQTHLERKNFKSKVIYNGINLDRFKIIHPINDTLKKVLSLSQSQEVDEKIKNICHELEIEFYSINKFTNPVWEIENIINKHDLVIGIGRSAYDSIACGRPVLIYDNRSYINRFYGDGYLLDIFDKSIEFNCSGRFAKKEYSNQDIRSEFLKYHKDHSLLVRKIAEEHLDIQQKCDEYLEYYRLIKEKKKLSSFVKNIIAYILTKSVIYKTIRKFMKQIISVIYYNIIMKTIKH